MATESITETRGRPFGPTTVWLGKLFATSGQRITSEGSRGKKRGPPGAEARAAEGDRRDDATGCGHTAIGPPPKRRRRTDVRHGTPIWEPEALGGGASRTHIHPRASDGERNDEAGGTEDGKRCEGPGGGTDPGIAACRGGSVSGGFPAPVPCPSLGGASTERSSLPSLASMFSARRGAGTGGSRAGVPPSTGAEGEGSAKRDASGAVSRIFRARPIATASSNSHQSGGDVVAAPPCVRVLGGTPTAAARSEANGLPTPSAKKECTAHPGWDPDATAGAGMGGCDGAAPAMIRDGDSVAIAPPVDGDRLGHATSASGGPADARTSLHRSPGRRGDVAKPGGQDDAATAPSSPDSSAIRASAPSPPRCAAVAVSVVVMPKNNRSSLRTRHLPRARAPSDGRGCIGWSGDSPRMDGYRRRSSYRGPSGEVVDAKPDAEAAHRHCLRETADAVGRMRREMVPVRYERPGCGCHVSQDHGTCAPPVQGCPRRSPPTLQQQQHRSPSTSATPPQRSPSYMEFEARLGRYHTETGAFVAGVSGDFWRATLLKLCASPDWLCVTHPEETHTFTYPLPPPRGQGRTTVSFRQERASERSDGGGGDGGAKGSPSEFVYRTVRKHEVKRVIDRKDFKVQCCAPRPAAFRGDAMASTRGSTLGEGGGGANAGDGGDVPVSECRTRAAWRWVSGQSENLWDVRVSLSREEEIPEKDVPAAVTPSRAAIRQRVTFFEAGRKVRGSDAGSNRRASSPPERLAEKCQIGGRGDGGGDGGGGDGDGNENWADRDVGSPAAFTVGDIHPSDEPPEEALWRFDLSLVWAAGTRDDAERKQRTKPPEFHIECELVRPERNLACQCWSDGDVAEALLRRMVDLLPAPAGGATYLTPIERGG